MQDQVARLKSLGIGAEYLGSAQTAKVRAMNNILSGEVRVVYVTPEFCENQLEKLMEVHQARVSIFSWQIQYLQIVIQFLTYKMLEKVLQLTIKIALSPLMAKFSKRALFWRFLKKFFF